MADAGTDDTDTDTDWAPVVPELIVSDFDTSVAFWCDVLGFEVQYRRSDPDFVMLRLGRCQVMLCAWHPLAWQTAALEHPYGRGINLEMEHDDPAALAAVLETRGVEPFRPLTRSEYEVGGVETVQWEILVQDPDGYLLRFVR